MGDTYTHGHQEAVLRSHRWRSVANSAAYLVPHLVPGQNLLDIGCGPGTITVGLAALVAPGLVVGVDQAPTVIDQARLLDPESTSATDGHQAVEFRVGDVYSLEFAPGSFDVVHAHQVLQHLSNPVAALTEMGRVLTPGGLIAVRDSDYAGFIWSPADPLLDRWSAIYHAVCRRNRAEADAGRHLRAWVRRAGFVDVTTSSSVWTFAEDADREWWGGLWADRCLESGFAEQAIGYGIATGDEMSSLAAAWRRWAGDPEGFFAVPHVEVLARREG